MINTGHLGSFSRASLTMVRPSPSGSCRSLKMAANGVPRAAASIAAVASATVKTPVGS